MKFTVWHMISSYERWDNVEAESKEELLERIEREDLVFLGEPSKDDVTSDSISIDEEEVS